MRNFLRRIIDNGPTREGLYYLSVFGFVLGGAMLREINLLLLFAGLLAAPLVANGLLAKRALRKITVRRGSPEMLAAGDELTVALVVEPRGSRVTPQWLSVRDTLLRESPGERPEPIVANVDVPVKSAAVAARATYRGRLARRGRYRFGPLKVATTYPFGLIRRTLAVEQPGTVLVCPRLGRLSYRWAKWQQETWRGGQRTQGRQGAEGEFFGLRDWRPGDNRRSVHWRTTARRGNLIVRQFEQQNARDLVLLLDLWQPPSAKGAEREAVERAVSFAATALEDVCRRGGCRLVLGIAGREVQVLRGTASQRLWQEALELLALCEATSADRVEELRSRLPVAGRGSAGTLFVTTRSSLAGNNPLLESYSRIRGENREQRLVVGSAEFDDLFSFDAT